MIRAGSDGRLPGHQERHWPQGRPTHPRGVAPGRFAVLVPNSSTIGISKRLPDGERRRLRKIIDEVKPERHGIIIRTAAEGVNAEDLARDVTSLVEKWSAIEVEVARPTSPASSTATSTSPCASCEKS